MSSNVKDYRATPPDWALWLGGSGLLPFFALALASWYWDSRMAAELLEAYAIAILSFMGGVHWGLAMANRHQLAKRANAQFAASVIPALYAVATTLLPPVWTLVALIAGFVGLLAYDLAMVKADMAPKWYPKLRIPLTIGVSLALAIATLR